MSEHRPRTCRIAEVNPEKGHSIWVYKGECYRMHCYQNDCHIPCPAYADNEDRRMWLAAHFQSAHPRHSVNRKQLSYSDWLERYGNKILDIHPDQYWNTTLTKPPGLPSPGPIDDRDPIQQPLFNLLTDPPLLQSCTSLSLSEIPQSCERIDQNNPYQSEDLQHDTVVLVPQANAINIIRSTQAVASLQGIYHKIVSCYVKSMILSAVLIAGIWLSYSHVERERARGLEAHSLFVRENENKLEKNPCCFKKPSTCPSFSSCEVWDSNRRMQYIPQSALQVMLHLLQDVSWGVWIKMICSLLVHLILPNL